MLGEEAAEQRTRHVGDAEDDAEVAHVLAPLPGRHDVAHDGLGPDHQPAGPDPLDRPEGDEFGHGLGQPDSTEPTRKITMASWKSALRP